MKRKAILVDKNIHSTTFIMVDEMHAHEILPYTMGDSVSIEFKDIRALLKENLRNKDKYCKADVSNKAISVFEMRFTRNGRNDRIYCKEISFSSKRFIVMSELFIGKKTQDISKKISNRLEVIGGLDYELIF